MGQCYGKSAASKGSGGGGGGGDALHAARLPPQQTSGTAPAETPRRKTAPAASPPPAADAPPAAWPSPSPSLCGSPSPSPLPPGVSPSPARPSSTPHRLFRRPFPPPSPAKHIKASLVKRFGFRTVGRPPKQTPIPEEVDPECEETVRQQLDKNFGYGNDFEKKYELGKEVGRGHFGHTCAATVRYGDNKGATVAVKIISKEKMTTPISIEDVRREVKILRALSGHDNLVEFYDAYYVKGVVHRDLKPENFLFTSRDDNAPMKLIDFGLSDFVRPDERLNDIVGSAYYVAPEVLHRSYSMEADMWSIGVITYILLCGSRPFWARTESGIFRSVLRANPNFDDSPWPSVSAQAKDFVTRFLNKDYRKRMTAAQALTHPWLQDRQQQIPLDILIFKLVKQYLRATPLKRNALMALSRALTEDEFLYLKSQFNLLDPHKDGHISLDNFQEALMRSSTEAMKESKVLDVLNSLEPIANTRMDFAEFCAAAISPYQLESLERWQEIAEAAFQHFEREGNRAISVEELAQELSIPASSHSIVEDWIRTSDRKLNFLGYTKFLHGVTLRSNNSRRQ